MADPRGARKAYLSGIRVGPHAYFATQSGSDLSYFPQAMSYGYNNPFPAAAPQVQIQRVGGWKLLAGAMLAAAGLGFAGFVYLVPYQKLTKLVHERTTELSSQRGSADELTAERDKLKEALDKRLEADQEKTAGASKRTESLQALAALLKADLAAVGANVSADEERVRVSFSVPSLFEQPLSTAISPQGETALKVVIAGLKRTGMRGRVKAKLIQGAPPRELAQFKNVGEFEMLRAARVMLVLGNGGVAADHLMVAGEAPAAAAKKGRTSLPDRLDVEIEPE
jgi:hypothetical protein